MPLGIPAIVFASQVNSKVQAGDYHGAMEASRKAKMWSWISFGLGLLSSVIWVVIQFSAGFLAGLLGEL
jgi:hypothetical protein